MADGSQYRCVSIDHRHILYAYGIEMTFLKQVKADCSQYGDVSRIKKCFAIRGRLLARVSKYG